MEGLSPDEWHSAIVDYKDSNQIVNSVHPHTSYECPVVSTTSNTSWSGRNDCAGSTYVIAWYARVFQPDSVRLDDQVVNLKPRVYSVWEYLAFGSHAATSSSRSTNNSVKPSRDSYWCQPCSRTERQAARCLSPQIRHVNAFQTIDSRPEYTGLSACSLGY